MDSMTLSEEDGMVDDKHQRILFPNGVMITDTENYMQYMAQEFFDNVCFDWSKIKILPNRDSQLYYEKNIQTISFLPEEDLQLKRQERNAHTEEELNELYNKIINSDRYYEHYEERILEELDYFDRSNNVLLMLHIDSIIEQFRNDGVIWGVGRGSSCASLVLYCLKVHDVDSLYFDIPFKEFSKE